MEQDPKLQEMYDSGMSVIEIAKQTGWSKTSVRRRINTSRIDICSLCKAEFSNRENYRRHMTACDGSGTVAMQKPDLETCKLCGGIFHIGNYPKHIKSCGGRGTWKQRKPGPKNCGYCNRKFLNQNNCKRHEKYCKNIQGIDLQSEYDSGLSCAQLAEKYSISIPFITKNNLITNKRGKDEAAKLRRKQEPEKFFYGGTKRQSRGEKVFKEMLEESGISKQYETIEQYNIFGYRLDFAILEIKLNIEIDGMQHYTKPKIRERDVKRNQLLIDNGWTVYRIASKDFLARPKIVFGQFRDFLESIDGQPRLHLYPGQVIDGDAKWTKEREEKILSSGIDFQAIGWTIKLGALLKVNRDTARKWVKSNMPEFYKNNCRTPRIDYNNRNGCS